MRLLCFLCCACLLGACTAQPFHQPVDETLVAELGAAIRQELPHIADAPEPGPWIDEQARMLATTALVDPDRIAALRAGSVDSDTVKRQSGAVIALLKAKRPGARPPILLQHLHEWPRLSKEQQVLLYCLVMQCRNEVGITEESPSLKTE